MDRRDFIKSTGLTAAAVASGATTAAALDRRATPVAAPNIATGIRELRVAAPWPQTGRGFDDSARRLAQSIATLSDGRLRLTFAARPQGLAAMTAGDADVYHGAGHDFIALNPAFAYFAGLPGKSGVQPTYLNAWLAAGGGQQLWDDLSDKHGFKPLFAGHAGARSKLWSRTPIANLEALQGLRVAAAGLTATIAGDLGATPVATASADLGAALAGGRIDAVEWGGTISGFGADLHRSARFCYRRGLAHGGFAAVLAVRTDVWTSLTAGQQALVAAAASQELNTVVAESLSVSAKLRNALSDQQGITFAPMPVDVVAASASAAARAVASLAQSGPDAARIHANYTAFKAGLPAPRRNASQMPIA